MTRDTPCGCHRKGCASRGCFVFSKGINDVDGLFGKPLAKKLTLKPVDTVWRDRMPASVAAEIDSAGLALTLLDQPHAGLAHAHIFTTRRADLAASLARLMPLLQPAGMIRVSWPKKASKLPTEVNEDMVRELALPMRLVDIKVRAVEEIWLGLKLVIRKHLRGSS